MPQIITSLLVLHESFCFTYSRRERVFRAHFGLPSILVEKLFQWCLAVAPSSSHFLLEFLFLALFFLKTTSTSWEVAASKFKIDIKTFKKRLTITLDLINKALPDVSFISSFLFFIYFSFSFLAFT